MELQYIKTKKCPICGNDVIVEEAVEAACGKIREHVHGGRWETRTFACGYSVKYIPNFNREEQGSRCEVVRNQERQEAETVKNKCIALIQHLDLDEKRKQHFIDQVKYWI